MSYASGYYGGVKFGRVDFMSLMYVGAVLLSAFYAGLFMASLIKVHMQTNFLHGFYRPFLLPGPFVDDRYTYPWYFLLFHNLRVAAIPGLIWLFYDLQGLVYSAVVSAAFNLLIVLDILLLLAVFVMGCFFCNNGVFRNGLCDTKNRTAYCEAFWKDQWEICEPGADPPPLDQCDLSPNPAFNNFAYFLLGFLALDIVVSLYIWLVRRWSINAQRRATNMLFWRAYSDFMTDEDENYYERQDAEDYGYDRDEKEETGRDELEEKGEEEKAGNNNKNDDDDNVDVEENEEQKEKPRADNTTSQTNAGVAKRK